MIKKVNVEVEEVSWSYVDGKKIGDSGSVACSEVADAIAQLKVAKAKLESARFRIGEILKQIT